MNKNWQNRTFVVYRILIDEVLSVREERGVGYIILSSCFMFLSKIFTTKCNKKECCGFIAEDEIPIGTNHRFVWSQNGILQALKYLHSKHLHSRYC